MGAVLHCPGHTPHTMLSRTVVSSCLVYLTSCSTGMALPLGESDPQFSSPRRTVIFEDEGGSDPYKRAAIDSRSESDIDPALLQAVLSDPILLQAVDPLVLQAVLVSAAAANLARPNIYSQPQPAAAVSQPIVFPAAAQASHDSFALDSPTSAQASHDKFI